MLQSHRLAKCPPINGLGAEEREETQILVAMMPDPRTQRLMAEVAHNKMIIQQQIDATDKQIDQLVYALYGLTEEEIKIVEGKDK